MINWLQCSRCAEIIELYKAEKEDSIQDSVTTIESPFDDKFQIETIPKRNSRVGKRASAKHRQNKIFVTIMEDVLDYKITGGSMKPSPM